ncbi:NB-ARC domain-containing protein [Streptomyces sp. NPDC088921]|uniref:NB-ARC domain-containing protein n=1 Tax=unclassified Streptomyces TaxID=2593676 RepID=UPI003413E2E3
MTSLAENAATGQARWPGPLDAIRRYAWVVLGVGLTLALLLALYALVHDSGSSAAAEDPPAPAPPEIPRWVVDRAQVRVVVSELLRRRGHGPVGITATAGLHGAGGFGKTTLAEVVWADRRIQRRFRGRIYRITLGLDVRSRAEITAKVAEATRFITGDTEVFDDPDLAGAHLGRLLDARPPMLLLLDDVWNAEQLAPFLIGGAKCRRLITTRLPELLPGGAYRVKVDEMSAVQARQVLGFGLPGGLPENTVLGLLRATGRWPLLLRVCNQYVHRRMDTGLAADDAAAEILGQLRREGPAGLDPDVAVDLNHPRSRQTAVAAAVEAGAALLPPGGFERFTELGIFAEDESIPVDLVTILWQDTGALRPGQSRDLCAALGGLSLLELDPARGGRIRLHDVIRDLIRSRLGDAHLERVNGALIDAVAAHLPLAEPQPGSGAGPVHAWWQHPDDYLPDHLITHILDAGRTSEAEALALDLRWIERRLAQGGATAPLADLDQIPTASAQQAAIDLARTAHLLAPIAPDHALGAVLRSRLAGYDTWQPQTSAWRSTSPALYNRWPLPDMPDSAQIRVLTGHTGLVSAVAISPDGTWLATGGDDRTVRIWDAATGQITATLTGHGSGVNAVAISPDGTWLATGGDDRTVRIWDAATVQITATLNGHAGRVNAVAISPDGTWLATGDNYGVVRIWDAATGQSTATLTCRDGRVYAVAISPDGTWLATRADGTVRIWDAATGQSTATLTGHAGPVYAVAISSDGTWLATSSRDRTVRIWDAATRRTTTTLTSQTGRVIALAISPDGTWLATGDNNGAVRIWDAATGQTTITLTGHTDPVYAAAISPDGTWLATVADGTVRIWDTTTRGTVGALTGHTSRVNAVAIPATSSRGRTVRFSDAATGRRTTTLAVHAVAISPDGTWLVTGDNNGAVRIWDAVTGQITATFTGHTDPVYAVAISPDGTWLAAGDSYGAVQIWDAATGQITATLTGHVGRVYAVAISPDGTWLATGDSYGAVQIWDAATGQITATLTGHGSGVNAVAISSDGTWLATGDNNGAVRIWDAATGQITATLTGHADRVSAVAIAPDGTWLAIGDNYGAVRIWDAAADHTPTTIVGHSGWVSAVAISPDGTWLATSSVDRTVRIWNPLSGDLATTMRTEGGLRALDWTPTSGGLATAGDFGLYLYDFDPGSPPAA